jgi:hypothetical protein
MVAARGGEMDSPALLLNRHIAGREVPAWRGSFPSEGCARPLDGHTRHQLRTKERIMKTLFMTKGAHLQQDMIVHALANFQTGAAQKRKP